MTPDPSSLHNTAQAVAASAAAFLRDQGALGPERDFEIDTKSSPTDLVTIWDRRCEAHITEVLGALRPDDGILGEEGAATSGRSGVRWIIDPIDGTTNFAYGLAPFAVSVAAEVEDRIVAGAVADPLHGELFSAAAGCGAWCNDRMIRCSRSEKLELALVGTGFSYLAERRRIQGAVVASLLPEVRDIRRSGSAATDLCWVAAGRLDATYERGLGYWDYAAGALIAQEAGALVTDLHGSSASSDFLLASAPGIHDPLRKRLAELGAGSA